MRYSEFKREVEKLGFVVDDSSTLIYVDKNEDGETLMSIGRHKRFWLDLGWSGFNNLTEDQKLELYDLSYQLAKTPPTEREEEKKYRVKFPNIKRSGLPIILTKVNWDGSGYTTMDWPCESYIEKHPEQFTFTEQEIKDIDERYFLFAEEVKK